MSDLHPLSGAYAVDALDDLERARFERHLITCADCAEEVAGLRETAAMLASALDTGPSPELRSRVLQEIASVRPLPPAAPVPEVVRRTTRWFPKLAAAAVASVVLATGVGVSAWHPWTNTQTTQVSVASRVLDAADAKRQTILVPGGGVATAVHSRSVGKAILVTKNMPKAPTGEVYEVWLQDATGSMIPAGLMQGGKPAQTVVLKGGLSDVTGIGITVEPAGGSKAPTSAPVVLFDLRKST